MGMASALVTNSMLEHYGITAEQLKQDAFARQYPTPFEIKTMAEVLNELMGAEIIPKMRCLCMWPAIKNGFMARE